MPDVRFHRGLLVQPDCRGCPLDGCRKVPPEGNLDASVVLIGEAPGENEERDGRPFIGASGQYLNVLLKRLGVEREAVFITNSALCKPRTVHRPVEVPCPCRATAADPIVRKTRRPQPGDPNCTRCHGAGVTHGLQALGPDVVLREATQHCRSRLQGELLALPNLRVVVPLGARALGTFVDRHLGIQRHRGAVHIATIGAPPLPPGAPS